jgi:hypothetical protein
MIITGNAPTPAAVYAPAAPSQFAPPPVISSTQVIEPPQMAATTAPASNTAPAATNQQPVIPSLPPFKAVEQSMLPLKPGQIKNFRRDMNHTVKAAAQPMMQLHPRTVVINLRPGGRIPTLNLAYRYLTSITVTDSMGSPWPITSVSAGDPALFYPQPISKNKEQPTILVSDKKKYAQSNMALSLSGMPTPILLHLQSDSGSNVDYRVILRIRALEPGATPSLNSASNHDDTAVLLRALYGVMGASAEPLQVSGAPAMLHTRAWKMNGKIWLRTRAHILAPAWVATERSPDGTRAYALYDNNAVLLRFHGQDFPISFAPMLKIPGQNSSNGGV